MARTPCLVLCNCERAGKENQNILNHIVCRQNEANDIGGGGWQGRNLIIASLWKSNLEVEARRPVRELLHKCAQGSIKD